MDWAKAKTIIIIALLVTNLILIISYGIMEGLIFNENENTDIADTLGLLEKNNIFVEIKIPEQQDRMPVLFVEYDQNDSALLEDKLRNQQSIPAADMTEEAVIALTKDFLESCGWLDEQVVYQGISNDGSSYLVNYRSQVNGIPLEGSAIQLKITNGRITDAERIWLNPLGYGERKKNIMPAINALLKLINEKNSEDRIQVNQIQLVYWLDTSGFGADTTVSDTAFPAWKISYNQGEFIYVPAFEE